MLPETFRDHEHTLRADARNLCQALRVLGKNGEGILPELTDDQYRRGRADPADQAAAEIALDAQEGSGRLNLAGDAFELAAVGLMLGPLAGENRLFPGTQLRQGADDSDLAPPGADGQHGPSVFLVAENGSKNSGLQLFHEPLLILYGIPVLCHNVPGEINANKRIWPDDFFRKKAGRQVVE